MKFVIETARDVHLTRTEDDLRKVHARFIAKRRARGVRVQVHTSSDPKQARVDHGRWLLDCECGAGVAADPSFSTACCMGCGAIHTDVRFPSEAERLNIEHVLVARTHTKNRNWDGAKESLLDLAIENAEHGVRF